MEKTSDKKLTILPQNVSIECTSPESPNAVIHGWIKKFSRLWLTSSAEAVNAASVTLQPLFTEAFFRKIIIFKQSPWKKLKILF